MLRMFVIYKHPIDFPKHWVVRVQMPTLDGRVLVAPQATLCDSLEEARAEIPEGLVCLERAVADDPVIYEVWL